MMNLNGEYVSDKDAEIASLKSCIERLNKKLDDFEALNDGTPADCKRGAWCEACVFSKRVIRADMFGGIRKEIFFCTKNDSCSSFIAKEKK